MTEAASIPEAAPDVLPFGPYAGQDVASVAVIDPAYLLDLVREGVGPTALRAEAARALARRGRLGGRGREPRPPRARWTESSWPGAARLGAVPLRAVVPAIGLAGLAAWGMVAGGGAPGWAGHRDAAGPGAASNGSAAIDAAAGRSAGSTRPPGPGAAPLGAGSQARVARPSNGTAALAAAAAPPGTLPPCGARVPGAIPAESAGDFVDTYQAVEFPVVRTKDTGRVTFLNSRDPYQGHFYVAIFPSDYGRYPEHPALYFRGKCVVVQGTIELYRGTAQMVLRSPDDVRIVGDAAEAPVKVKDLGCCG